MTHLLRRSVLARYKVSIFESCKIRPLIAENVRNSRSAPNNLQVAVASKVCSVEIRTAPASLLLVSLSIVQGVESERCGIAGQENLR